MNSSISKTELKRSPGNCRQRFIAFTLIELLLVITIIGILAALGLPHLKGWGEGNTMTSASRQMMDDLALARQRAISSRSTVYIIFVSAEIANPTFFNNLSAADKKQASNLLSGQYTTYALFTQRAVGEQPGHLNPKYLTAWKSLPDKTFIATNKFIHLIPQSLRFSSSYSDTNRPFAYESLPFPTATSPNVLVPCVAFNSQGQLISEEEKDSQGAHVAYRDGCIPLTKGSIFYARDSNGAPTVRPADVVETPSQNSITNYNNIRIDWLTGRARLERKEF